MAKSYRLEMTANWQKNFGVAEGRRILEPLGDAIVADAKRFAPVDTGELKNSISHKIESTNDPLGVALIIQAAAEHAAHVELGTRRMAPQPYLRPAVEKRRSL